MGIVTKEYHMHQAFAAFQMLHSDANKSFKLKQWYMPIQPNAEQKKSNQTKRRLANPDVKETQQLQMMCRNRERWKEGGLR